MDFRPSEEQELLRRTVRDFAESEIAPHVSEWDESQQFSMDLLPKLAALLDEAMALAEGFRQNASANDA